MNQPDPHKDIVQYNEAAWNEQVKRGCQWTVPVSPQQIAHARKGDWSIILTPTKPVPRSWFPDSSAKDVRVLCLAGSGGQQAPILAAAGFQVTVLDLSENQLAQDRLVAEQENLDITTVKGTMVDLGCFENEAFDLIIHPCSNSFVPDIKPVWKEAARVLRPGGHLLSGFTKPVFFIFDYEEMEKGNLIVKYSIPYSDLTSISDEKRKLYLDQKEPLCFGHSLTDQIGGQIEAGLRITGYFEDTWPGYVISEYIAAFAATKATKPDQNSNAS
ncbi:MAG: class I SAM-dependent methyltransferase [Planctomycetota bacterium]